MSIGMLAAMPWWHYALMVCAVAILGPITHERTRRTYLPRHGTIRAGADRAERVAILVGVELLGATAVITTVTGGMLIAHAFS